LPRSKRMIEDDLISITLHVAEFLYLRVNLGCCAIIMNKYQKHFSKMYRDVGMAVPKTTQTRYMDGSV